MVVYIILILILFGGLIAGYVHFFGQRKSSHQEGHGDGGEPQKDPVHADLAEERIRFQLDVAYASSDNSRQRLDIFRPIKPHADKLPAVVFFHGGGWTEGDKKDGLPHLLPLVRSGRYIGVSVEYRTVKEAVWPAQLYDCKAAIRWIREHAEDLGMDPQRIAVWGQETGAYLALMLGLTGDRHGLEGGLGAHRHVSSKVAAVVNYAGVTDLAALLGQSGADERISLEAKMLGRELTENETQLRIASPVTHVSAQSPPVLTVHGTEDLVVPFAQAVCLDKALIEAGRPSYLIPVKGAGHGEFPAQVDNRTRNFLDRFLLDLEQEIETDELYVDAFNRMA